MNDEYSRLPRFSWRGVELPLVNRRASFSHQEVTHAIQYASGQIIEITVRNNWRFDYTIPFREGIIKGPYRNLFTQGLGNFVQTFLDSSPGELVDPVLSPILGSFSARPLTLVDSSDIQRRDGDDLEVSFVENKTSDDLETTGDTGPSAGAVVAQGRDLDAQIAIQDWGGNPPEQISSELQEWTQETPPEPSINPIDAVAGVFRQAERVSSKSKAVYQDTNNRLIALEDAIRDSGNSIGLWNITANARSMRLNVLRAESRERSRRRLRSITRLPSDMTPTSAAALVGLSLTEFLALNEHLSSETILDQGTLVTHYR